MSRVPPLDDRTMGRPFFQSAVMGGVNVAAMHVGAIGGSASPPEINPIKASKLPVRVGRGWLKGAFVWGAGMASQVGGGS